ncbi:GTPase ObgE [Johnsonella ignava]|uniref:GTPase ObgE n=1 Tax=Johnsonella ignava TaxID=43995 RepID=UPI0023F23AEC|nr:GTPase ObgE [Johnsonella ignava]
MFSDSAKIFIKSGNGGDGHVSFRRELYVAAGGPDGGDGGRGGSIIFEVDKGLNTLAEFRHVRKYAAKNGEPGGKRKCHGKDAPDLIIKVPEGTVIKDFDSGKVISDMSGENRREVILRGGRGGLGNMNFATATMQVPKFAKPGQPGKELYVKLELKVIADVGLVGFPNAGKSTLLSRVSNAKPKIADYHFTTLNPYLGVVDVADGKGFVMADIPGLIEGASKGAGLGHDFLRHIERTKILVHVVDAASIEGRDPVEAIKIMQKELSDYSHELTKKPCIIAANKIDLNYGDDSVIKKLRAEFSPDIKVYAISGATGEGIKELLYGIMEILDTLDRETKVFEREFEIDYSTDSQLPYSVEVVDGVYVIDGPSIEKIFGYTNLDSEKGFDFFQKYLKKSGILEKLEALGIKDGDTVRMCGHEFDYYK